MKNISLQEHCELNDKEYLLEEYDYEKNKLSPSEVAHQSNKKVWWKCKEHNHSYQSRPADRIKGKGCSICSGKIILSGFNDLFTTNPELKETWDFENNDRSPLTISKGSRYMAHWKCHKGHTWTAVVYSRACNKNGCPICAQGIQSSIPEKIIYYYLSQIFGDIEHNKKYPEISNYELDIYVPSLKIAIEYDGSNWHKDIESDKKKDDVCFKNGIHLIRIRDNRCPIYESSAHFIHIKKPSNSMKYMDVVMSKLLNHLENIFKIHTSISVNIKRDYNNIIKDINLNDVKNSIGELYPKSVKEWHPTKNGNLTPYSFKPNSNISVWWKCSKCGYEWEAVIESRFGNGRHSNCPCCARNIAVTGVNDLKTLYPEVANRWDYDKNKLTPEQVAGNSNSYAYWRCEKGHTYRAAIHSQTLGKHQCPYCCNQRKLPGYNDLATTHPVLCEEWHPTKNGELLPTQVSKGTDKKVWWKCSKCGYEWQAMIYSRTSKHPSGCPECYRKKRGK